MKITTVSTHIFHPNWRTLLYVVQGEKILLALKKRGFGAGYYNGMGGKPNSGESPIKTALREAREEVGIAPQNIRHAANIHFTSTTNPALANLYVYVFVTDSFDGEPIETEEMSPRWFFLSKIPYDVMWDDDQYWLPKVLAGNFVCAEFRFDSKNKVIHRKIALFTPRPRTDKNK